MTSVRFQSNGLVASGSTTFVLYIVYNQIRVDHQSISQFMTKRYIQRLQRSIQFKRFKIVNTRECSIDNVIQLIQCRVHSRCHLDAKELFISGSVDIILSR